MGPPLYSVLPLDRWSLCGQSESHNTAVLCPLILSSIASEQEAECKEPEQEVVGQVSQVEQAAEYKQPEQCSLPNTRVQRREEHAHLVRWLGLGLGG